MHLRTAFFVGMSTLLTSVTAYGIDARALSQNNAGRLAVDNVPTPLSDFKRDDVPTPLSNFKRDDVPTPLSNFKRDDVPTPLSNFKRDDVPTPLSNFKRDDVPTPLSSYKRDDDAPQGGDDDTFVPLNSYFRLRRT